VKKYDKERLEKLSELGDMNATAHLLREERRRNQTLTKPLVMSLRAPSDMPTTQALFHLNHQARVIQGIIEQTFGRGTAHLETFKVHDDGRGLTVEGTIDPELAEMVEMLMPVVPMESEDPMTMEWTLPGSSPLQETPPTLWTRLRDFFWSLVARIFG
jgi:hypothetical protein